MYVKKLFSLFAILAALCSAPALADTSLWASNPVPPTGSTPSSTTQFGTRFYSDVNGSITAIRFYKSSGDQSTHTLALWTAAGVQLAVVTTSGETASGWQTQTLTPPVAIVAGQHYVVSRNATAGYVFGYSTNMFASAGVDVAPLHAPANSGPTPQAPYITNPATVFPNVSSGGQSYYVDVVFSTTPPPPPVGSAQSSIWPAGVPATTVASTATAYELGTRFYTDIPANVIALRWYKVVGETGTHKVSLWRSDGVLLAQVTQTNETASGWQTQLLPSAIFLSAGTSYVVSRQKTANNPYPVTVGMLSTVEVFSPPLHAPKTIAGALNGARSIVTTPFTPVMPNTDGGGDAYFVDVVILPGYCGMFQ